MIGLCFICKLVEFHKNNAPHKYKLNKMTTRKHFNEIMSNSKSLLNELLVNYS